ncbi:DUF2617 family protein [Streptomyces capparidis]
MSGVQLAAPYLDTAADQLRFTLGLPPRDALAVAEVAVGGITVELRLLGASHQVFAGPVRETVACLPGEPGLLPGSVTEEIDGWTYRFTARIHRHGPREFAARAGLLRELHGRPEALCGVFPGAPDALTALLVRPREGGVAWRTWHTYPRTRQIVATHTRLEAR